jgi:hypothetical protein
MLGSPYTEINASKCSSEINAGVSHVGEKNSVQNMKIIEEGCQCLPLKLKRDNSG